MASSSSGPGRTGTDRHHEAPPPAEPSPLTEISKPYPASSRVRLFFGAIRRVGKPAQYPVMMPTGLPSSRMSGTPNFELAAKPPTRNRLPHSPALPVASAIPDIVIPYPAPLIVFHIGDQTMTHELERQIEELRAELRNAVDPCERRQIETELDLAQAELTLAIAETDGSADAEPPF